MRQYIRIWKSRFFIRRKDELKDMDYRSKIED